MRKYLILLDRANRANRAGTPFYFLIFVYLEAPSPKNLPYLPYLIISGGYVCPIAALFLPHYCPIQCSFLT